MEILIFQNDGEPPGFRVLPDGVIGRFSKAGVSHVFRAGECVAQAPDELMREIVVEQQSHDAPNDTSRRSRSAANARRG